ncbi:MAG: polysaccharide export protein [Acidobacteriaceae bacterium]|jgi:polysaccharide export outer membrane protein|nr:polysaccharide export protein [Acidobacteriaceae bacterium]
MKQQGKSAVMLASVLVLSIGQACGQTGPAGVAAQRTRAAEAAVAAKAHDSAFLIGSGDLLAVNVWKEPDVSRSVPVRPDGRISLPLVGEVQASGRTPLQLEHDIAGRLKTYISDADVTVIVEQINSEKVNVLGRIQKPGSYPILGSMTVLDAISMVGGFVDFAKQKDIYILRSTPNGQQIRIPFNYKDVIKGKHPEQNIRLQAHDTVIVP